MVQGVLRTARRRHRRATGSGGTFAVVLVVYAGMTVAACVVLRSMARRWRDGEALDLPSPYGPRIRRPERGASRADGRRTSSPSLLFIGVMAYAVFGGADFGSGFCDLTAGDDASAAASCGR